MLHRIVGRRQPFGARFGGAHGGEFLAVLHDFKRSIGLRREGHQRRARPGEVAESEPAGAVAAR